MSRNGRKLRVVHVVESMGGGVLQSVSLLCRMLADDFEFHLIHGQRPDTPENFRDLFPDSVRFYLWDVAREVSLSGDRQAYLQLQEQIAEIDPDVVHAHSSKAGAITRLALSSADYPVFYSPRGYSFLRLDLSPVKRRLYRSIEWLLGRKGHRTVACGEGEWGVARKVSRHSMMIQNMVDLTEFPEPDRDFRAAEIRVVMVGRICPQKNFPLFCAIAEDLADLPIWFIWVGDGEIPDTVSVPCNVEITGWQSKAGVLGQLAESHVFMQTSLWEGLPNSVLEALTMAMPLLAYPCIGNEELVDTGENGYLCSTRQEFAGQLRALFADRDELERLSRGARRSAANQYDARVVAPLWKSAYEKAASNRWDQ